MAGRERGDAGRGGEGDGKERGLPRQAVAARLDGEVRAAGPVQAGGQPVVLGLPSGPARTVFGQPPGDLRGLRPRSVQLGGEAVHLRGECLLGARGGGQGLQLPLGLGEDLLGLPHGQVAGDRREPPPGGSSAR